MHRLLKRQLRKTNLSPELEAQFSELFDRISRAYETFDKDLVRLENILEKSSRELFVANQKLKEDVEIKSEEIFKTKSQLERVLANVKGVIFETDHKGEFIFLNPAWESLTGYKIEECIGHHYSDFLVHFEAEAKTIMEAISCANEEVFYQVLPAVHKNGQTKWVEITFKSILNEEGSFQGAIGSIIDVSNLKETEIKLQRSQDLAKKASQAKEDFLSTMSHEIRTPLNGVIGITNILLMEEHLESQQEHLQGLKFSSEHLLALINDILDYNKIEAGKIDLEEKDFDFNGLLAALKRNFDFQAAEKGIKFKIKRDEEIPSVLVGDSTRLSQILNNLLSNAIKFTSEGQVVLDIEEVHNTHDTIDIHFQIKDTGIGIPEEKIPHIFEKFKQADSNTTRKYGGSGLGLSICKSLLELMKSNLNVTSVVNEGSNFNFKVQFKKSDKAVTKIGQSRILHVGDANLSGTNILVAEDNKLNQHVVKRFLAKWGADFDIVENGQEAVDKFAEKHYDIILMDLQMPIMNGYDASRLIKEKSDAEGRKIPIIALTASAHIDVKFKTRAIGMTGFLPKPFNPVQLYETIKEQISAESLLS